jgi:hypothetical protein
VDGIDLDSAVELARGLFDAEPVQGSDAGALLAETAPGRLVLVGADGRARALTAADPAKVRRLVTDRHPEAWGHLDSAVLHAVLADQVWQVREDQIGYHHDAGHAIAGARRAAGIAVLLAPVDVGTVLSIAAQGVLMPRKSTSFGPKPRTGFVLRTFDDDIADGGSSA